MNKLQSVGIFIFLLISNTLISTNLYPQQTHAFKTTSNFKHDALILLDKIEIVRNGTIKYRISPQNPGFLGTFDTIFQAAPVDFWSDFDDVLSISRQLLGSQDSITLLFEEILKQVRSFYTVPGQLSEKNRLRNSIFVLIEKIKAHLEQL